MYRFVVLLVLIASTSGQLSANVKKCNGTDGLPTIRVGCKNFYFGLTFKVRFKNSFTLILSYLFHSHRQTGTWPIEFVMLIVCNWQKFLQKKKMLPYLILSIQTVCFYSYSNNSNCY